MQKKSIFIFAIMLLSLTFTSAFNFETGGVKIIEPVTDEGQIPVMSIQKEHFEMHEGDHYFIKTWLENAGGSGTSDYFAFHTPNNNTRVHAKTVLFADADTIFYIFENCTITGGVQISGINNDRDSNNVAQLIPFAGPTIIDSGTLIFSARNGGGKNPVGVSLSGNYEIIAKTNTTYCFEITKQSTANTIIDVDFFWYEEHESHE